MLLRSAIAYVADSQMNNDVRNHELSWINQAGVSLAKRFDLGLQVSYIDVWGNTIPQQTFYSAGIFLDFKFTPNLKFNVFVEGNFNRGNYCPCIGFEAIPEKRTVYYFGIGPGIDYPIFREKLRVSAAITLQAIVGESAAYNYGRLGLALVL